MKVQVAIIVIVIIAAALALMVFSGALPGSGLFGSRPKVPVVLWGIFPEEALSETITRISRVDEQLGLSYVEKSPETLETDFLNALAKGQGPDLVILPPELVFKQRDKFLNLAPVFITERTFRDTFVDGTEILLGVNEIRAVPFLVDPLMLYWNRDLSRNESFSQPPKTWDELLTQAAKLTKIDQAGNISTSGVALGLETNVLYFKEILSMLILQAGNPIVETPVFKPVLARASLSSKTPAENALRFYTEFARPSKASYTWSAAQPNSSETFLRGNLAFYFAFASELPELRAKNPHLNFDLTSPPQIRGGNLAVTYGRIHSFGIPAASLHSEAAFRAIQHLLESDSLLAIAPKLSLAPAKRALLSESQQNPFAEVVFREAVRIKSWPEIDAKKTSEIFAGMIRSVYSGAKSTNNAVRDAEQQLQATYPQE